MTTKNWMRTRHGAGQRVARGALLTLLLASALVLLSGCLPPEEGWPDRPTWPPENPVTAGPAPGRVLARVSRVVDGDTIVVEIDAQSYTVRYIGIDAPETVHPQEPVEWMGPEASAVNAALVEDRTVYLEKDVSETDRYGRLLRHVFLGDGTLVSAELVRRGFALVSTYPPDVKYQDLLLQMQGEARAAERGLWGPRPTPQEKD
jgi:micrococcal nuclease